MKGFSHVYRMARNDAGHPSKSPPSLERDELAFQNSRDAEAIPSGRLRAGAPQELIGSRTSRRHVICLMEPIRLLYSAHVGRRLGVGPERVRELAKSGRLRVAAVLPNGSRLFVDEDVEALRAEREAKRGR